MNVNDAEMKHIDYVDQFWNHVNKLSDERSTPNSGIFFYFPIWMDSSDGALHEQKILSQKINKRSLSHLLLQTTEHEIVVSRDKYVM